MRRRLLTFTTGLSLLLCAATLVLWVASYWNGYAFGGTSFHSIFSVDASRGRIGVLWAAVGSGGTNFYHALQTPPGAIRTYGRLGKLGFYYDGRTGANGASRVSVVFPIWALLAVTGLMPCWWLACRIRQRNSIGRCTTCSYDLTGNASGVCPECGTAVEGKALM